MGCSGFPAPSARACEQRLMRKPETFCSLFHALCLSMGNLRIPAQSLGGRPPFIHIFCLRKLRLREVKYTTQATHCEGTESQSSQLQKLRPVSESSRHSRWATGRHILMRRNQNLEQVRWVAKRGSESPKVRQGILTMRKQVRW